MIRQPRNAAAITEARRSGKLKPGDSFVVSFIGSTDFAPPHVFVDSGKRYDWGFAAGLHAYIVTRPGTDPRATVEDVFRWTTLYPTFIDVDRKVAGSVVDIKLGKAQIQPWRIGSEPWQALFG